MDAFNHLPAEKKLQLLRYPVYLFLLALNADEPGASADSLATPLETFNFPALLGSLYAQARVLFIEQRKLLDSQLPEGRLEREVAIKVELRKIKELLREFQPAYAFTLHQSMKACKDHISTAYEGVLDDYLFPIPIKGLTDQAT